MYENLIKKLKDTHISPLSYTDYHNLHSYERGYYFSPDTMHSFKSKIKRVFNMINDFFVIVQVSNKYGDGDRYIENVILDCLGTVHRFYNGNDLLTFTNSKKANEHFIKLKEESEEFYENLIRESLVTLMFQYNKYKELNDIMGPKHDR